MFQKMRFTQMLCVRTGCVTGQLIWRSCMQYFITLLMWNSIIKDKYLWWFKVLFDAYILLNSKALVMAIFLLRVQTHDLDLAV